MDAQRLSAVVPGNLKRVREDAEARQDDVAAEARRFGLRWTRATVAAIETGRRQLTIDELPLLPAILSAAIGRAVTSHDLYASDDVIALTDAVGMTGREVAQALSGRRVTVQWFVDDERQRLIDEELPELADVLSDLDDDQVQVALEAGRGEAEGKVAISIGVLPGLVGALAVRLWGRSLSEERDARVGSDGDLRSLQARRGHATRRLIDELRVELDQRGISHR